MRLRQALEELGGVYLAYGVFLQWRSDVLTSGEIEALAGLNVEITGLSRGEVEGMLAAELGAAGAALAASLCEKPVWRTLNRTAFAGKVQDQEVVVEVAHPAATEDEIAAFRSGVAQLGSPQLSGLQSPVVLNEFVDWLRTSETLENERAYLDAISQYGGDTGAVYPLPIPMLSTSRVMVWATVDGTPVEALVQKGDPSVCGLIARAVLEQFCALGMVECDLRLDSMVITACGKLGFRRLARPAATPPGLSAAALEYVAAAIARDASLSSRTLLRLAISYESPLLEKELISHLSAVDPELKVHRWFPQSAETFEANWRAVSKLGVARHLFLDCLHRNLVASGYWIGETVRLGARPSPRLSEQVRPAPEVWEQAAALWPQAAAALPRRAGVSPWLVWRLLEASMQPGHARPAGGQALRPATWAMQLPSGLAKSARPLWRMAVVAWLGAVAVQQPEQPLVPPPPTGLVWPAMERNGSTPHA